jgi:hypothetical protein
MKVQTRLPPGWWIHLYSEYGEEEAYWIARLGASQASDVTDWPEAVAERPEAALAGLLEVLDGTTLDDAARPGLVPPTGSQDAASFAAAWRVAQSSMPPGWWISWLDGFDEGRDHPAGWLVGASRGPDSGYDGEEAIGLTPEQALTSLGERLRSRFRTHS